jgi:hypothetical protein
MRQEKAIGLNGTPNDGNPGAPELLVIGVPGLDRTGFSLNAVCGFKGIEPVELAVAKLSPLLPCLS